MQLFKVKAFTYDPIYPHDANYDKDGWSKIQKDVYINPYHIVSAEFKDDDFVIIQMISTGEYWDGYKISKEDFDVLVEIVDIEAAKKIKHQEDFKANAAKILLRKFDKPNRDGFEFGPPTTHTYNALVRRGVDNIAKMYAVQLYWEFKVKCLRNIGVVSVNEINGFLKAYGLPSLEEISCEDNHNEDVETIRKLLDEEIPEYISYIQANCTTHFVSLNQANQADQIHN